MEVSRASSPNNRPAPERGPRPPLRAPAAIETAMTSETLVGTPSATRVSLVLTLLKRCPFRLLAGVLSFL